MSAPEVWAVEQIDRMVWEETGHRLQVFYAQDRQEVLAASYDVASQLARSAGLSLVPATRDRIEWVRVQVHKFDDDMSIASRRSASWARRLRRSAT
jgi:hypothetical protein